MSTARPETWMPLYIGDYLGDTTHLSTEQHGAYLLLLMTCWKRGGTLPIDDAQLAQIARLSSAKWRAMKTTILAFFLIADSGITHKRINEELAIAAAFIEKQKRNGAKGGRPRNPTVTQTITQTKPNPKPKPNPKITTSPSPSQEEKNAIPAIESLIDKSIAIGARSSELKKLGSVISGSGKWDERRARDEFATAACIPHLPGRDDGERWGVAMAAEDPTSANHQQAVRLMLSAAKQAGVGWVSPARRAG